MLSIMRRLPWRKAERAISPLDLLDEFFSRDVVPMDSMMGVNLYEEGKNLVVEVNMPGFNKDEIELTVSDDSLTVKAEKKVEEEKKDKNYYYREFSYSSASRTIPLPKEIDVKKVKAKYENGILKIVAPKKEAADEGVKVKIE